MKIISFTKYHVIHITRTITPPQAANDIAKKVSISCAVESHNIARIMIITPGKSVPGWIETKRNSADSFMIGMLFKNPDMDTEE